MEDHYLFTKAGQQSLILHTISDHLSDAVIIIDKEFTIEYLNDAACYLFGFTAIEIIGSSFLQLLPSDKGIHLFETLSQHIAEDKSWQGVLSFTTNGKSWIEFPVTILPANDENTGNGGFIIISRQDQQKRVQRDEENISKEKIILSEQKWRSLLDNTKGAIFLIDTNYHIVLLNERAEKILSHSPGWPGLQSEAVYCPDLLSEERRQPFKEICRRVFEGEKVEYEVCYPKQNGEDFWLLVGCMPVKNKNGDINQICITTYNITKQKEKEAALISSEQRWKFALEGAGDGVWEYNFQTKESYYSPLYKSMLGFSEDEFSNSEYEWYTRVHPDDIYKVSDIDKLYEKGSIENHSVEYRLKNKEGEYLWILDRGMLLERTSDGKPLKLIGTHTNITERKKAEERLIKSEQRFSSFMDNTPTMAWIIDEYAIFRYLNASYMRAFHLTEEAVGKSVYEVFPKEICDQFIENNWKVWNRNMAIELTEEGVGPDGLKQIYQIYKFPLNPENGVKLLGGVALDITKKLELEQQLAAEEAQKKREIIQAIINAQEKERREISYELHDNVNQILSSSRLMLEVAAEKPELSNEFTHRSMAYLKQAIAEIRRISHNLTPVALTDISLEAAIEDVVQNINATGKLKIDFYKKLNGLENEIDPEKQLAILRIIQEQFSNILKHAHASEATISLVADDKKLFLEIQDNGQGFDQQNTKKGLGLNNMFNRVEYYHGSIQLISSTGKGCTLQIEVPI